MTLCALALATLGVASGAKPFITKRLSYGEGIPWSFGGWRPIGSQMGFTGMQSQGSVTGAGGPESTPTTSHTSENKAPEVPPSLSNPASASSNMQPFEISMEEFNSYAHMNGLPPIHMASGSSGPSEMGGGYQEMMGHMENYGSPSTSHLNIGNTYTGGMDIQNEYQNEGIRSYKQQKPLASINLKLSPKPLKQATMEAFHVMKQLQDNPILESQYGPPALAQALQGSPFPTRGASNKIKNMLKNYARNVAPKVPGRIRPASPYKPQPNPAIFDFYPPQPLKAQKLSAPPQQPPVSASAPHKEYGAPQKQQNEYGAPQKQQKDSNGNYMTVPVAVETDMDKVLSPQDIREIEREVRLASTYSL